MSATKAIRVGQVNALYVALHNQYDAQRGDGMSQREALSMLAATLENFERNVKRVESDPVTPCLRR